jgi:hypothetical protein
MPMLLKPRSSALVAVDAAAARLAAEDVDSLDRQRVDRLRVALHEAVVGRVVGDERCLVGLDREAEEEREVVLQERVLDRLRPPVLAGHDLGRAVGRNADQLLRPPPARVERLADQRLVALDAQPRPRPRAEAAEDRVLGVHELPRERPQAPHAALDVARAAREPRRDLGKGAPARRHLARAERRRERLRGQARVLEAHANGRRDVRIVGAEHARVGVGVAEAVHAVEDVRRAAVPEVAVVEHRVDDARRVARCHLAQVQSAGAEAAGVGQRNQALAAVAAQAVEAKEGDALRADHVVRPRGQREVARFEGAVHGAGRGEVEIRIGAAVGVGAAQAGIELVARPAVGTRVEVAARARLHAVAADLHVPEERLAERDRRLAVADELAQVRRLGHGHGLERRRSGGILLGAYGLRGGDGRDEGEQEEAPPHERSPSRHGRQLDHRASMRAR